MWGLMGSCRRGDGDNNISGEATVNSPPKKKAKHGNDVDGGDKDN